MANVTAMDVKNARVIIELEGEEVTLTPSPDAIISLSAKYDGLGPLINALQRVNVQASVDVVVVGAGAKDKEAKTLANKVVREGVTKLMPQLLEFVFILANGGKPLKEADDDGEKNPPEN